MQSKTVLIILISVFYVFGLSAHLCACAEGFALSCFLILSILIFSGIIKIKHALVLFFMFVLGFYNMAYQTKQGDDLKGLYANNAVLEGMVVSIPQISSKNQRAKFYLDVSNAKIYNENFKVKNTKTLVSITDKNKSFTKIKIGDTISIKGNLRYPKAATNPSQFDYAKYLKYKDTFSTLYSNDENFTITNHAKGLWWKTLAKLDTTRDEILQKHSKIIKSPQLEILGGIVFGNETINPPDDIKQSFVSSGLLHLLAASGLNVALIFGLWWFIAQSLRIPFVLSVTGGMFFVILYTFMTGFPPSILRASIMILFVLAGKLIDRQAKPLALIFFVGFLMLLVNPKMFGDVGFQLSFVVTIGLICTIEPISSKFIEADKKFKEKIKNKNPVFKFLFSPFAPCAIAAAILVPLSAQIFVAPLQMYYFNTFTPWSLFANLCVLPFIGIISFLGFISSIAALVPYIGDKVILAFDIIVNPLLIILVKISQFFSHLKYSIITMPSPSIFTMFLFWGLVILLVENIKRNFGSKILRYALIAGILVFFAGFIKFNNADLEIIAFDVGNADSFLIKTPKNKYIMIDTGRLPYKGISSARMIMGEYLKDKNIRELEALIITHFDNDHSGGSIDILENFKVKNVYIQTKNPDSKTGYRIIRLLDKQNINYKIAKNNDTIYKEEDITIKTYCANIKDGSDNDNSIITFIESKDLNALFMADGGINSYKKLENNFDKADILKVGHHGAKNVVNKQMLNKLNPHYAIISVGYNKYGHPNYNTLHTLKHSGADILLTRDLGAVKISNCKNHKVCKIENFNGGFKETKLRPADTETQFDKSDFALNLLKSSKVQR